MVESSGLLNRRSVKNATGGSNPPLSAMLMNYGGFGVLLFEHTVDENSAFLIPS